MLIYLFPSVTPASLMSALLQGVVIRQFNPYCLITPSAYLPLSERDTSEFDERPHTGRGDQTVYPLLPHYTECLFTSFRAWHQRVWWVPSCRAWWSDSLTLIASLHRVLIYLFPSVTPASLMSALIQGVVIRQFTPYCLITPSAYLPLSERDTSEFDERPHAGRGDEKSLVFISSFIPALHLKTTRYQITTGAKITGLEINWSRELSCITLKFLQSRNTYWFL